jgi:hypothetical protein
MSLPFCLPSAADTGRLIFHVHDQRSKDMSREQQKWLPNQRQFQYTSVFDEFDVDGHRLAAEQAISEQLSTRFLLCSMVEHGRYAYHCALEHFPLPEGIGQADATKATIALVGCLYCWHDSVKRKAHPTKREARAVSKELLLLALSFLHPAWVTDVAVSTEEPVPSPFTAPQAETLERKMPGRVSTSAQIYYLEGDTDRDMHDTQCCCGVRSEFPHRAIGASLYELDIPGLQALNDLLRGEDEDSFGEWCNEQESQATYYGLDEEAAIQEALHQARKDGWLVINYPEAYPWMMPLLGALRGVVGNGEPGDGYLDDAVCECDQTHEHNSTVCRVCYARLVCHLFHHYAYEHCLTTRA